MREFSTGYLGIGRPRFRQIHSSAACWLRGLERGLAGRDGDDRHIPDPRYGDTVEWR